MAHTAHTDEYYMKEHFETEKQLISKTKKLAGWIKNSKHCIVYTGAGISTSTGIRDFRGPTGVWTMKSKGLHPNPSKSALTCIPSQAHMSIVELMKRDRIKYLASQNCDGLHRKSGVDLNRFSELHGNTNLEICEKCDRQYFRDFRVRNCKNSHEHYTGRLCEDENCRGRLEDTIVNFGEDLPEQPFQRAFANSEKADLCIVLGSSCTVTPASDIPETVAENGKKLVIVNLQKTPLNDMASLVIHGKCDQVMELVMEHLQIPIPKWQLQRRLLLEMSDEQELCVKGVEKDGSVYQYLKSVQVEGYGRPSTTDPYFRFVGLSGNYTRKANAASQRLDLTISCKFFGHYNEPDLNIVASFNIVEQQQIYYSLLFDPETLQWTVSQE
jgi:NAD-dependent SIR2 family protein deacetylase